MKKHRNIPEEACFSTWLVVIRFTSGKPMTTVFSTFTTSAGLYRMAAG